MNVLRCLLLALSVLFLPNFAARGEISLLIDRNRIEDATPAFKFSRVPPPARDDAAAKAVFKLVDGRPDRNAGSLDKLHDDRLPADEDQPSESFFFDARTEGGRWLVDLGKAIEIEQVNSYSWHASDRGPQVYSLFASEGTNADFVAEPRSGSDPEQCGWRLLARVDTRPKEGDPGGQYGVSIRDTTGILGRYRYLLFAISQTENRDNFGNTFYSEIDVVEHGAAKPMAIREELACREVIAVEDYRITLDTCETPDLTEWARKELIPMAREWYPKLVKLLPSDGFEAPRKVTITFSKDMEGVAATGGTRVRCAAGWFRKNLQGEAVGAVFHELVHVVQQYGWARRANPNAARAPGWLTEGIPDYLRWFKFEPQSHGAEITKRNLARARYDASYRITANFLDWASQKYDTNLVVQLNAAIRGGRYSEDLWKEHTGHTVQDLGAEWKAAAEQRVNAQPPG